MEQPSVFEKLASRLSDQERTAMLERIRSSVPYDAAPIVRDRVATVADVESEFEKFSFFRKVIVLFRSLIAGLTREEVVEDFLLRDLGRGIQSKNSKLIDVRRKLFLPGFRSAVASLDRAVQIFSRPVIGAYESEFFALLVRVEFPEVHERIEAETDPARIHSEDPDLSDNGIKRAMNANLELALETLPSATRETTYRNARFLTVIRNVAAFEFRSILGPFGGAEGPHSGCPFDRLRDPVTKLAGLMASLNDVPTGGFLEAVALYHSPDIAEASDTEMERRVSSFIAPAGEALNEIRDFIKTMPLTEIARIVNNRIDLVLHEPPGGEDWFVLYRRFWNERNERLFKQYAEKAAREALTREAIQLTNELAKPGSSPERIGPGRFAFSLGVAEYVYRGLFLGGMATPLKTLLIDGDFYKDANRDEFTAAYNAAARFGDTIDSFRYRAGPDGPLGNELRTAAGHGPDGRRRYEAALEAIEGEAEKIVNNIVENFRSIYNVVNGVLYGESGGRYDTLTNIGQIAGRHNKEYQRTLARVQAWAQTCTDVVGRAYDLDARSRA